MRFGLRVRTGKHAGREIPIEGARFLIGSADNCHLKFNANQVSQYHCALLAQDDGIWVRDYGGGTVVNGVRIVDRLRLDHGDRLQIGSLHFEVMILDAPAHVNERAPDDRQIAASHSPPVERPVARAPEPRGLGSVRSESPNVDSWPLTAPLKQAEPVATAEPSDVGNAQSEPLIVASWPLTAPSKQAEPATTAEPSDLGNARSEPPNVASWPITAPSKPAETATTAKLSDHSHARSESKVAQPWYSAPSKRAEPADVVASNLLKRFFIRKNAFNDKTNPAPAVVKPKDMSPSWWRMLLADGLDPNLMFVLGILVGIGLSAAAFAFITISGT